MASLQINRIQQTNVSIMQTQSHTAHPAGVRKLLVRDEDAPVVREVSLFLCKLKQKSLH